MHYWCSRPSWWPTSRSKATTDSTATRWGPALANRVRLPSGSSSARSGDVVMESTAQYWRPVWETLELHWKPKRRTWGRREPDLRHAPSRTSAVESRSGRPQEGFSRRGTCVHRSPRGISAAREAHARRIARETRSTDLPRSLAWVSIPRSRSSRPRRFYSEDEPSHTTAFLTRHIQAVLIALRNRL